MTNLLHQLIEHSAKHSPESEALVYKNTPMCYRVLWDSVCRVAGGLVQHGLQLHDRVAVFLPQQFETVICFFASAKAGSIFVPINPALKTAQVQHIVENCTATFLLTSMQRYELIKSAIPYCRSIKTIIFVDPIPAQRKNELHDLNIQVLEWSDLQHDNDTGPPLIDSDPVAILYTSGSTGKAKGVVLSHRNLVTGAESVAEYLHNTSSDRILALLPLSFDYGLNQLTTAFHSGACAVLMNYLLPIDVIKIATQQRITGIAGIPTLWKQLLQLDWPDDVVDTIRYITNSGAAMPSATLARLRRTLPNSEIYLMYGLTEAFRSTFLPPTELDRRSTSIGKAIPNAEVMVVRKDGTPCAPEEPGELVHRGALVSLGYWNDPAATEKRFKPAPLQHPALPIKEIAVWSGDTVRMDKDGYFYFIGRKDSMIKTSGYRVSPEEIENIFYQTGIINEVAALGVDHPDLGQAILIVAAVEDGANINESQLLEICRQQLPNYMLPRKIIILRQLPRNQNGKIDRNKLLSDYQSLFTE